MRASLNDLNLAPNGTSEQIAEHDNVSSMEVGSNVRVVSSLLFG